MSLAKCSARSSRSAQFWPRNFHGRFIHQRVIDGKLDYASPADATKRDTLGYVKDGRILVDPTAWRSVLCAGYDPEKTARHLKNEGLLIADEGKLTAPRESQAGRRRCKGPLLRARPKNTRRRGGHWASGGVVVMCNSIFISPLDRFCGGTGGTGGTAQDFGASRWYRRVGPVGPACRAMLTAWNGNHGGPTGPTHRSHQKSAELPAVPPVPPVPPGSTAVLSRG